jgi:hypothetical protein
MHGEFLRLHFLQAHRETEAHFTATGMPSQRNRSVSFRFKRAVFYQSLKSKVGLAAAKPAALRAIHVYPQHLISLRYVRCPQPMSETPDITEVCLPMVQKQTLPSSSPNVTRQRKKNECPMCNEAFPTIATGKCFIIEASSSSANCVNI